MTFGIEATKEMLKGARLFVKKPIPIRAIQITQAFWVKTIEGVFQAKKGDYLICGIRGELYACDREIFEESYKEVTEEQFEAKMNYSTRKILRQNIWFDILEYMHAEKKEQVVNHQAIDFALDLLEKRLFTLQDVEKVREMFKEEET